MYISNRYCNVIAKWLDEMSFLLMNPWLTVCSRFFSCYISTIFEKLHPQIKLLDYFIFGPLYALLVVLLLPVGLFGIVVWLILCAVTNQEKYTYVCVDESTLDNIEDGLKNLGTYTMASANVLLAPEAIARLNNNKCSYGRASKIAEQILNHTGKPLCNLMGKDEFEINTKCNSILTEFPCLDFLCLQEVWERSYALVLIEQLKEEFLYFLYDIGDYSFNKNFCMLGSGLFFASKKPILNADFNIFTRRTKHAKFTSQGVLCVKVLLHFDEDGNPHVGYIANTHTQAFQGSEVVLLSQLTDILIFVSLFKEQNTLSEEIIDFDIICGDFNADNISPADMDVQQHSLFGEYQDVCVVRAGQDVDWAIGTELRQCALYQPDIQKPANFRKILVNDSLRRLYVLDADVLVHSMHLMTSTAQPGPAGYVEPLPCGGRRRVDRILYKGSTKEIIGYCFLSALTNLTDHLPVCMTWKPGVCHESHLHVCYCDIDSVK